MLNFPRGVYLSMTFLDFCVNWSSWPVYSYLRPPKMKMHTHVLDIVQYLNRDRGWLQGRLRENHNLIFYFVKRLLHWDDKETMWLNSEIPWEKSKHT